MKCILLVLAGTIALAALPVDAAQSPAMTEISVSGTGTVALPPDTATVSATVETLAPNAGDAVSRNNALYDRIVAALQKMGVARSDVTLSFYNVSYNPRPDVVPPNPDGERYGYTVSRGFSVKVRAIGKAGSVADACTRSGATSINGVAFGLADPSVPRAEATRKAVDDARVNAQAVATAAGLRLLGIKSIDVGGAGPVAPMPMMRMAAANAAPTQFDQSSVSVSISVNVTFLAEP